MEVAIAVAAGGLDAFSAMKQQDAAEQEAALRTEQIRSQQVQLRLQDVQQSIAEQKKLQQVTATAMVQLGSRGISSTSGTVRAIFNHNYGEFDKDKDAARLNLEGKENALNIEQVGVGLKEHAQIDDVWIGFGKSVLNEAMDVELGQFPSGATKSSSDSVLGSALRTTVSADDGTFMPTTNPLAINP